MPRALVAFVAALVLAGVAAAATAPSPIPSWYWGGGKGWVQWYLGNGGFRCLPFRSVALRPASAPKVIPQWAWDKMHAQLAAGALFRPACNQPTPPPPPAIPPPVLPPQPAPPPPPTAGLTADEQTIVDGSNLERALNSDPLFCGGGPCAPLQVDMKLVAAARDKIANNAIRGGIAHDYDDVRGEFGPAGYIVDFGTWFRARCANTAGGENLAAGYAPSVVSNAWVHHPGHRENLLNSAWHYIGTAYDSRTGFAGEDFAAGACQ